ncbi:protein of unknown function (plasmid) [Cupriavidus taiwanensis]|uniref:Uncharacterized protein n=1 Tax=Cupriavidus taiwanensis TaxID=164546 RepID=A0A375HLS3_9BURK|nr:hypothetical protein CBM2588_B10032 [Cupriavidus taiwanensis]SOY59768.1 hypothetical protein CBM2592_B10032 [Cupriavidus taiwanensis]SOY91808.1 hypothetical protein CBM2591_B10032 [Cupriavidus taiwanensis]SOZ28536.1 hypothetical protein CBM2608_B140436 [Cupriavidus taiwanensis]SOZ73469.1 hypothetical protein CBM2617_B190032 [Cupriavidus taiwanensis]
MAHRALPRLLRRRGGAVVLGMAIAKLGLRQFAASRS